MIGNPDMTQQEAEAASGLKGRHLPLAQHRFLRCQLGREELAERRCPKTGWPIAVTLFYLVGYGGNWGEAAARAAAVTGLKTINP